MEDVFASWCQEVPTKLFLIMKSVRRGGGGWLHKVSFYASTSANEKNFG